MRIEIKINKNPPTKPHRPPICHAREAQATLRVFRRRVPLAYSALPFLAAEPELVLLNLKSSAPEPRQTTLLLLLLLQLLLLLLTLSIHLAHLHIATVSIFALGVLVLVIKMLEIGNDLRGRLVLGLHRREQNHHEAG